VTIPANYTPQEWDKLSDAPLYVGGAVMVAAKSGVLGTLREGFSMVCSPGDLAKKFPHNALIQGVVKEAAPEDPNAANVEGDRDPKPEVIQAEALACCRTVADILARKASPTEATEYRTWLLQIGWRVANAAREGGRFGLGGQRVSEAELAILRDIAEALGLSRSAVETLGQD
jgi:hypothetical protein